MTGAETDRVMATLVSINVGMPQDHPWRGRVVHTGVWKRPVGGRTMVRRLNIEGDGQGDLAGHGGEQRAVLVYQLDSYRHWEDRLGLGTLAPGSFGENFTVDGLADAEVCIGDRFRIGEAEFEVTQPRVTCFRVGMRMMQPELPALLVAHHRPGFYLRVITEGYVAPGDDVVRIARGREGMSVAEIDALLYLPQPDRARIALAAEIPALSPGWRDSFRELSAATGPDARAPGGVPTGPPPAWPGFRTLVVSRVVPESATVDSYYLASGDGEALPRATPGQFLTVRVPGAGDPPPVRAYSLSGNPEGEGYRISVKREPLGRVASYLHDHLRPGDRIDVAAPRGDFVLDAGGGPVLLVSAGIGVTPVLALLHQLAGDERQRDVWWIHATHDSETYVFGSEVADLLSSLPDARSVVCFSAAEQPLPIGVRPGRLTAELIEGLGVPPDASAYVCGPSSFMDDMEAALVRVGLDARNVHVERFGSRAAINPGIVGGDRAPPHSPSGPPGTGPEVTFARSGLATRWSDIYSSVLELAEACHVPTRWSCRAGVCHTCVTAVLAGGVRYTTLPLDAPGQGEALICSSRPAGDLVLDL